MDQSEFNNIIANDVSNISIPKRKLTAEFFVGLFAFVGVTCAGYLAIGLGGLELFDTGTYQVKAKFDNISGLKYGASVEMAGVPVGEVVNIELKDPEALVTLKIRRDFRFRDDDILSIRTKGIIGDRYIRISRGSSDVYVPEGGEIPETESVVDIEDIIGKFIHSFGENEKNEKSGG